jgi:hypothetical protein
MTTTASASALETETYIVVSTAHLSKATAEAMTELPIICDVTAWRFRVPFASTPELCEALPDDLAALLAHVAALAPDAYGVMIDCDGPLLPGLAVVDW